MVEEQISLRLPANLEHAAEKYAELYGFKNLQELIAEALREKVFFKKEYDNEFSEKEIDLIDELVEKSIKTGKLKTEKQLMKALQ